MRQVNIFREVYMFTRYPGVSVVFFLQMLGLILVPHINGAMASAQESVQTFTLVQSIDYALGNSREFQAARKDVELAVEKAKETRAMLLPQLTLDARYRFEGDLSTIVLDPRFLEFFRDPMSQDDSTGGHPNENGAEPIEIELGAKHNLQGQAQIVYPLFTWGRLSNIYRQAVLAEQAAESALEAVELDVELKVRQAFHAVLLMESFVEVSEQALTQVEKRYKLAQEQKTAGITTRLEVIRANVQVVNTRSQLIQARNQRKLAKENLKLTLGLPLDQTISIEGELHAERKQVDIEQAIITALERRPEIHQFEIQEHIGEKQIKVAKAGNKPTISTFGNYMFNDSERQVFGTAWNVGFAIQFPIFDGFSTRAQVNQARIHLDQLRTNKDQILDGIKLETKAAVFDLRAAEKLIEVQEGIVEEAAEALRIANAQHETGMITGVELTDVEMSHTQAQVNQLQAIHDYIVAVARVERAIGSRLE